MPLPPLIHDALAHNAAGLSPITVAWTKVGSSSLSPDEAVARFYIYKGYFTPTKRRVIWQDGKIYAWGQSGSGGSIHEDAFDGLFLEFINSDAHQFSKRSIADVGKDGTWLAAGFTDRAGVHLPATGAEIQSRKAVSEILKEIDAGATLTAVDSVRHGWTDHDPAHDGCR